jgi:tetratricopeptide (TPR) repeat protein
LHGLQKGALHFRETTVAHDLETTTRLERAGSGADSSLRLNGPASVSQHPPERQLHAALSTVERLEAQGQAAALCGAWMEVARCYRALQALEDAQRSMRQALRVARISRSANAVAQALCALAENTCDLADEAMEPGCEARRAAMERARDEVFEASSLLLGCEASPAHAELVLRLSDVLNRCGDHDDAAVLQGRALLWMAQLQPH